jgi:tripartite-type tricarboxylate transporter receptor subunit TctC
VTQSRLTGFVAALACLTCLGGRTAVADPVADFYKGRTLTVLVGVSVGGEYDLQARLVARHIGRHIPGNPTVVSQNMTGAGGLVMANWLYNLAPKDGTVVGVIQNGFPAQQAVGLAGIQFDAGRFNWIGSIAPTVETLAFWKSSGVKSVEDARRGEVIVGSVGKSNITYTFPMMMNEFAGTKYRIVTGYPGGSDINLAMERGEVAGRNNTWSSWKATKPKWLEAKDITIVAYEGPTPKDLPGVPSVQELASNEDDRIVIRLIASGTQFGRPMVAPPGIPEERVAALRGAYDATMRDPEFLKEAATLNIEVDPVAGARMQKIAADLLATPQHLRQRARPMIE